MRFICHAPECQNQPLCLKHPFVLSNVRAALGESLRYDNLRSKDSEAIAAAA
jgi:hypothetical protein